MANFIVKLKGKYLYWSTVTDSPITYGMSREGMKCYLKYKEGATIEKIEERLKRADENGTSLLDKESAEAAILFNRAGDNEEILTKEQIIEKYIDTHKKDI